MSGRSLDWGLAPGDHSCFVTLPPPAAVPCSLGEGSLCWGRGTPTCSPLVLSAPECGSWFCHADESSDHSVSSGRVCSCVFVFLPRLVSMHRGIRYPLPRDHFLSGVFLPHSPSPVLAPNPEQRLTQSGRDRKRQGSGLQGSRHSARRPAHSHADLLGVEFKVRRGHRLIVRLAEASTAWLVVECPI